MTLHATVQIGSPALETSVGQAPGTDVTIEQRTGCASEALDLTLRARSDDLDAFEAGLDADETVARWIAVGGSETSRLYRVRLSGPASVTMDYDAWTDGLAVFRSMERTDSGWTVEAYLPDRRVLQKFEENCLANDVWFELMQVAETSQLEGAQEFGLTELQSETLLEAFDRGYYTVPRQANLQEVADPLDVSHQALSERLRRGVGSLIENTITTPGAVPEQHGSRGISSADGGLTSEDTRFDRVMKLNS